MYAGIGTGDGCVWEYDAAVFERAFWSYEESGKESRCVIA